MKKFNLKREDEVVILTGKDRGKRGKVLRLIRDKDRIVVGGANMIKRHIKYRPGVRQTGIVEQEAPLHISNVMLVCPNCGAPTRVGRTDLADGTHVRQCKKCHEVIDRR
ncbi:MAG: 50S ribosomal protein L24 [Chloroflexota bacterium]